MTNTNIYGNSQLLSSLLTKNEILGLYKFFPMWQPCGKPCSPNSHSYSFFLLLTLFLRRFESGSAFAFVTISPVNLLTAGVTVICIFADK